MQYRIKLNPKNPRLGVNQGRRMKMVNHPNRSNYRYFMVSPRGFANEVTYYRVPLDKVEECELEYRDLANNNPGAYCRWTEDKFARLPGVAIDWADRHW